MSYHQHMVDHAIWVDASKLEELLEDLKKETSHDVIDGEVSEVISDLAAEYNFEVTWSDEGDIDGIQMMDSYQHRDQEEFLRGLAGTVKPKSFITMIGEDQEVWQWFFNYGKLYEREVKLVGVPTEEEASDALEAGKSGYAHCRCRDCDEIIIVSDGLRHRIGKSKPEEAYCDGCLDAGCPDYQGVEGMTQECQRPDAYGSPECPTCEREDEVYFVGPDWRCERCQHEKVFEPRRNADIRVKMYPNGSAVVSTGLDSCPWPKEMVARAEEHAQVCCESRRVYYPQGTEQCPCLACNVDKARRKHEEAKPTMKKKLEEASREELVEYLESWGFACYDSESIEELRTAALQNYQTEKEDFET